MPADTQFHGQQQNQSAPFVPPPGGQLDPQLVATLQSAVGEAFAPGAAALEKAGARVASHINAATEEVVEQLTKREQLLAQRELKAQLVERGLDMSAFVLKTGIVVVGGYVLGRLVKGMFFPDDVLTP